MDKGTLTLLLKMLVSLAAVLGVFAGAVFAFRKLSGASKGFLGKGKGPAAKPLEVLAFQSLGPGRSVYLVRCLDKKVLIGATNANITRLADIEDTDDAEEFSGALGDEIESKREPGLKQHISASLREISRV